MMKKLQYTISQKGWTDLRQDGSISFNESDYLFNIIRTQDKYFKDIYLEQYLLQAVIKNVLPESEKSILEKRIPISCQAFNENNVELPENGQILLELEVPDDQVVTIDYKAWLYLANEVHNAVMKSDSTKDLNKLLKLPEAELKFDQATKDFMLDVTNADNTMNFIAELKLAQVKKAYENADGKLSEIRDY